MTAARDLIALIAGFAVWSVAFVTLYAAQALGCAYCWGPWHRPVLIALYLGALGLLLWLTARPVRAGRLAQAAVWANRAALGAAALIFAPVTFGSLCV